MAEMTPDGVDLSDPIATFNPVNASALPYLFPALDWPTYFSALTVRPAERIIVASKNYLTSLDSLISRTRTPVIEAYFDWVAVRELGLNLGADVSLHRPADRLDRRSKGVDESAPEDRETVCLGKLNEALGFMSGRFFVEAAFSSESKARAEGIIKDIVVAFKERLPDLSWLDRKTRDAAEKKADAVRIKVGYPTSPNTTDGDAIERYYNDLTVKKDDYFGNLLAARTRDARRSWAYVGRKLDPGRWDMFTSEVNAYYNPGGNEIVFPAGILQPPYFSAGWPDYLQVSFAARASAVATCPADETGTPSLIVGLFRVLEQFGAFGAVAGHELSHAFDPDGRLYDEEGYLRDWWTKSTAKEFNKRRDCIIEQYGNYSISDGKGGRVSLPPCPILLALGLKADAQLD